MQCGFSRSFHPVLRVTRAALIALCLVCVAAPLRAEGPSPLPAVGRLVVGDYLGCTATLIEPDLVLAAAHCAAHIARDPGRHAFRTGAYDDIPPQSVRIIAGAVHPLYQDALKNQMRWLRFDLALLRLERAVTDSGIVPLPVGAPPQSQESLLLAGYRRDRTPNARKRTCDVLALIEGAFAINCEVRSGESGSPLMRVGPEGVTVAAMLTSQSRIGDDPIGFVVPLQERLEAVRDALPTP